MNPLFPVLSTAAALLTLTLTACGPADASSEKAPPPLEVGVVVAQRTSVAITTSLPGRTVPFLVAEVRPQVGGIIESRLFTEGADVRKGQPLYQVAAATYRSAESSARAALARAEANLSAARSKAARYAALATIDAVSQQDSEDAMSASAQAGAEVQRLAAELEGARINLDFTRITSPISGRAGRSSFTPGALVSANQPAALVTVQQLDPMYVDVTQSSAELLKLRRELSSRPGARSSSAPPVTLILEDGSHYPLKGRLQFSDITIDESTGSVTLRAVFPNPSGALLPGMYVRAVIDQGAQEDALLVPQQAISRTPTGEATLYVVDASGKVEPRNVRTSRTHGTDWVVESGLAAGDRVIVEGLQKITPGAVVTPVVIRSAAVPAEPGR